MFAKSKKLSGFYLKKDNYPFFTELEFIQSKLLKMKKSALIIFFLVIFCHLASATQKVWLLHGIAGSKIEMTRLDFALGQEGFDAQIYAYPSLQVDVDSVSKMLIRQVLSDRHDTVSFVTHSMGALVVRSMYKHLKKVKRFPFIYRIVMIAPPNKGSDVADFFVQFPLILKIAGPNVKNLTTDPKVGAAKYPVPDAEIGLIAGGTGVGKGYNILLDKDNDGLVKADQTVLGVEKDIVFVKDTHVGLLFNKEVVDQTILFLREGKFNHTVR